MSFRDELKAAKAEFRLLSLYQRFEHGVILILTGLIAIVIAVAMWNLILKVVVGLVVGGGFDPSNYSAFQAVFGMIFTVIIALEFKKSLLIVAQRRSSVVQIKAVVVIALLAVSRKVLIIDLAETDAWHIFSLAAAILALGIVYWLIGHRNQVARKAG
jgi:uncharacterized membrane protein (DUF373 family)